MADGGAEERRRQFLQHVLELIAANPRRNPALETRPGFSEDSMRHRLLTSAALVGDVTGDYRPAPAPY
jgi:hypothetical protein